MEYNPFVRIYRQANEVLNDAYSIDNQDVNVYAHLHYCSRTNRRYNLPSTNEIAVILPGDGHESSSTRDIVVYFRGEHELMRISECHPTYLPIHYVLLFPHGEMGWEPEMKKWDVNYNGPATKRLKHMDYYSHPTEYQIADYDLFLLEQILQEEGKSLIDFDHDLKITKRGNLEDIGNRLIWDQEHFASDAQHAESLNNVDQLNDKQ
ncbi:hypothetical protein GIB67_037420 [Kingdonia uniflora]|uniref:Uncharacterized protein n=1 Tax=Kingdonia uniflora TaxID=39325 RepID=A0A7J7M8P4_9MAGN|nr:hypothetical protein GIB67_037420 [Kingdonia uniflora]